MYIERGVEMAPNPTGTAVLSENQSTDPFSDRVAMAALVLGAGAFVIGFLQMIFQYYTSTLRDKCSSGAIGRVHSHVRIEWDIRNWQPRIFYPEVELDIYDALDQRKDEDQQVRKLFQTLQQNGYEWVNVPGGHHGTGIFHVVHDGWVFRRVKECTNDTDDVYGDIDVNEDDSVDSYGREESDSTESDTLVDGNISCDTESVRVYHLPFAEKIEWFKYLLKNPRTAPIRTRTSWANMLECLDVDPRKLVVGKQRADVIPTLMDGPLQNTTLSNLGLWCLVLGMKELRMDIEEGSIEARNKYARITTTRQRVPGISRVICLEGDVVGLEKMVDEANTGQLRQVLLHRDSLIDIGRRHCKRPTKFWDVSGTYAIFGTVHDCPGLRKLLGYGDVPGPQQKDKDSRKCHLGSRSDSSASHPDSVAAHKSPSAS